MSSSHFTESLEVELTPEEIRERHSENTDRIVQRSDLQTELDGIGKSYRNRIKMLDDEIEKTARILKEGKELRPVECKWMRNRETFEMRAMRLDTFEIIRVRPMTPEERQGGLFDDGDGKSDAAGAGVENRMDTWTAERCDECGRIDGGHTKECSRNIDNTEGARSMGGTEGHGLTTQCVVNA